MPEAEETTQTIIVPVPSDRLWFDPKVIAVACDLVINDVDLTTGNPVLIATEDSSRVAIGIALPSGIVTGLSYGPWSDPQNYAQKLTSPPLIDWYYLHEHLNLVQHAWYAFAGAAPTLRVITVRRNT